MPESHVVSGLVAKRSELAGMIEHYMQEIKRMDADLKHLDATIKLFDPDYDLRAIRAKKHRKKNVYFKPGECARLVLDVLREADCVLTTEKVALAVMAKKRLDSDDAELVRFVKHAAITALRNQANRGLLKDSGLAPDGVTLQWALA
jgi:hypothetical protein